MATGEQQAEPIPEGAWVIYWTVAATVLWSLIAAAITIAVAVGVL